MKKSKLFLLLIGLLVAACVGAPPAATETEAPPPATETQEPTATSQPTATPTVEPENHRVVIDMSEAVLENAIAPECIDQFPVVVDESLGLAVVCFTFDNWVRGPIELNDGYEIMMSAEGWYEQSGREIPVLIPLAVANRTRNEMQLNGNVVQEFSEFFYDGMDAFWESHLRLEPKDILYIQIAMPREDLASNSTQGFGFEAVQFTQEELHRLFLTGDFSILGNLVWPVIDIEARN